MEVEISGMDDLLSDIEKLGVEGELLVVEALKEGAEIIKSRAKQKVRVKTGNLKESIKLGEIWETREGVKSIVVGTTKQDISKAFYGKFLEYGYIKKTKNGVKRIKPKPYLRPAFDEVKEKVTEQMMNVLGEGIEKEFGR